MGVGAQHGSHVLELGFPGRNIASFVTGHSFKLFCTSILTLKMGIFMCDLLLYLMDRIKQFKSIKQLVTRRKGVKGITQPTAVVTSLTA